MSLSPIEFLNKLFDRFKYTTKGEKKPPPETVADISKFWVSGIRPFLHCELQVILYLQANKIQVQDNAIGNTKLMCWACNKYVARANKDRGTNAWRLSGTSEKSHYAWLIPSSPLGDVVVGDVMMGLRPLVSRFAAEFGRHRRQLSGGSDSGTGSNGEEEEDGDFYVGSYYCSIHELDHVNLVFYYLSLVNAGIIVMADVCHQKT